MALLLLVSLYGYHYFWGRVFSAALPIRPLLSVSLITIVVYLGELFHCPIPVCWGLGILGWLFSTTACIECGFFHQHRFIGLQPALVSYFALLLMLWVLLQGTHFSLGDEFSFWGTASHYLWVMHHLPGSDFVVGYLDYPLAAASFHQWVYILLGGYSEPAAYWGQDILLFSALWPLMDKAWGYTKILVLLLVTLVILAIFNASFPYDLMIDILLGTYMAGIAMIYYHSKANFRTCWFLIFPLLVLCLLKHSGFVLALWLCVYMAIDLGFSQKHWIGLMMVGSFVLTLILAHLGWSKHFHHLQAMQRIDYLTPANVWDRFSHWQAGYYSLLTQRFFRALLQQPISRLSFTQGDWLGIGICTFVFLWSYEKKEGERFRLKIAVMVFLLGNLLYILGLYASYLLTFSQEEALQLASFSRYLSTYALALSLMLVFFIARYLPDFSRPITRWVVVSISLLSTLFLWMARPSHQLPVLSLMQEAAQLTQKVLKKQQAPYRLFFFYSGKNSLSNNPYADFVLPYHYSAYCTHPSHQEDSGKWRWCGWNQQELFQVLSQFTHLVLVSPDEALWEILQKQTNTHLPKPKLAVFAIQQHPGTLRLTTITVQQNS